MSDVTRETHADKSDALDRNARKNSAVADLRAANLSLVGQMHKQAERIEVLEAALRETLIEVDKLGNHCVGCGHMCGDPEKDLAMIRKAGKRACCPERKMEPISATLAAMVPALTALKGTPHDG